MPPDPSNISLLAVLMAITFGGIWLMNYLLDVLDKARKDKMIIPRPVRNRLFYSHLRYGDTLGWTLTHTWTEPKKRKNYIEPRVQTTTKQLPSPSED